MSIQNSHDVVNLVRHVLKSENGQRAPEHLKVSLGHLHDALLIAVEARLRCEDSELRDDFEDVERSIIRSIDALLGLIDQAGGIE